MITLTLILTVILLLAILILVAAILITGFSWLLVPLFIDVFFAYAMIKVIKKKNKE